MSYKCAYNLIIGERRNGKSYSVLERIIDKIEMYGEEHAFIYIRRRKRHVVRRKLEELFTDFSDICYDKFGSYITYDGEGKFYIMQNGERLNVGYKTSIEEGFDDKAYGFGIKKYVTILFEEFMDLSYMEDEIRLFLQTIGNIVRNESYQDVEIFMLANTVLKFCPYLDFFGFDISKVKMGDIATIYSKDGGSAALERCKNKVDVIGKRKTSKYFGFDNATANMILHGEWEYNNCNIEPIDGFSWKDKRHLVKAYITALKNVYEMSYIDSKNPILFVRQINTQNGIVNQKIKYNLSFDHSINLTYANYLPVPIYSKISDTFMDYDVISDIKIIKECMDVGRVVYQNIQVGTEFKIAFDGII